MANINNENASYIVQNAGAATITYTYPAELVGPGEGNVLEANSSVPLVGFKLNGNYVDTQQAMDNSFIIPLLNGGSIQITNDNTCGSMTIQCIRTAVNLNSGDIVALATAQRAVKGGDSIGADITIKFSFNGIAYAVQFFNCTVAQCKPITLAGNDAPDYSVVFNYSHWDFI